ncbi:MAG TPA: MFS transporter [Acidimicrobiia bacterium]|nr:MFS transporter [Acidimicrobiia bacterium]
MAAERSGTLRAALRHPDFRRLTIASSVSQSGDWLYNVALAVFTYEATGSAAWVGVITVLRLVPYVVLAPIGGVIADRYPRRQVLMVSDLTRAVLMAGLTLVVATDGPVLAAALVAALTTAAGTAYYPAVLAFVPELVPESDLAAANGVTSIVENASVVVGPAIGGAILAVASPGWAMGINAASFVFAAAVTRGLSTPGGVRRSDDSDADTATSETSSTETTTEPRTRAHALRHELSEGVAALRASSVARALVSLIMATSFVYGVQTVVLVILASERVGESSSGVGVFYGALGVGGVLAAPLTSRLARVPRLGALTFGALLVAAVPFVLLVPVRSAPIAAALIVAAGLGSVVVDVLAITMLQRSLSSDVTGRVFGILDSFVVLAILAGSLVVAPLRDALGFGPMLVLIGIGLPVLVLAQLLPLLDADRLAARAYARLQPVIADLASVTIFSSLSRHALERLAAGTTKERFSVGETILREGDSATHCYTVLYGEVEIRRGGTALARLGPSDEFGEIGLLHGVPRTADAVAATDCVLYAIPADVFRAALDADTTASSLAFERAAARLSSQ